MDDDGKKLANAEFQVFNSDNELVATVKSNEQGESVVKDLIVGNYTIKEINAPHGYLLNNQHSHPSIQN